MKNFLFILIILCIFNLNIFYVDAQGLVPCGTGKTYDCTFDSILALINNIVDFIIKYLALPLAAIAIAVAGFLYLTSAENPGKRTRAKSIFMNVLIGLLLIGGSYLIIKTVLSILGYTGAAFLGF